MSINYGLGDESQSIGLRQNSSISDDILAQNEMNLSNVRGEIQINNYESKLNDSKGLVLGGNMHEGNDDDEENQFGLHQDSSYHGGFDLVNRSKQDEEKDHFGQIQSKHSFDGQLESKHSFKGLQGNLDSNINQNSHQNQDTNPFPSQTSHNQSKNFNLNNTNSNLSSKKDKPSAINQLVFQSKQNSVLSANGKGSQIKKQSLLGLNDQSIGLTGKIQNYSRDYGNDNNPSINNQSKNSIKLNDNSIDQSRRSSEHEKSVGLGIEQNSIMSKPKKSQSKLSENNVNSIINQSKNKLDFMMKQSSLNQPQKQSRSIKNGSLIKNSVNSINDKSNQQSLIGAQSVKKSSKISNNSKGKILGNNLKSRTIQKDKQLNDDSMQSDPISSVNSIQRQDNFGPTLSSNIKSSINNSIAQQNIKNTVNYQNSNHSINLDNSKHSQQKSCHSIIKNNSLINDQSNHIQNSDLKVIDHSKVEEFLDTSIPQKSNKSSVKNEQSNIKGNSILKHEEDNQFGLHDFGDNSVSVHNDSKNDISLGNKSSNHSSSKINIQVNSKQQSKQRSLISVGNHLPTQLDSLRYGQPATIVHKKDNVDSLKYSSNDNTSINRKKTSDQSPFNLQSAQKLPSDPNLFQSKQKKDQKVQKYDKYQDQYDIGQLKKLEGSSQRVTGSKFGSKRSTQNQQSHEQTNQQIENFRIQSQQQNISKKKFEQNNEITKVSSKNIILHHQEYPEKDNHVSSNTQPFGKKSQSYETQQKNQPSHENLQPQPSHGIQQEITRSRKQSQDNTHIFQSQNYYQLTINQSNRQRVSTQFNLPNPQAGKQLLRDNQTQLKNPSTQKFTSIRSPTDITSDNGDLSVFQTEIFPTNISIANSKLTKIRQAKQNKKKRLQEELAKISEEINQLSKKQTEIKQFGSPGKNFNQRIKINDNVQARQKAISLVKNLQKQKKARQLEKVSSIDKIDIKITDYMSQLTKIRSQNERKMKEKRKLQIIERMKQKQMKKINQMKKIEANSKFVSQFFNRNHEYHRPSRENIVSPQQVRQVHSPQNRNRASKLEDYEEGLTPGLADKKAYLNRVRNLSQHKKHRFQHVTERSDPYEQRLY